MKKLYAAVFAFIIMFSVYAYAEGQTVVDEANYLTVAEETDIEQRLEEIKSKYEMDVAVVIVNSLDGKTAEAYADDYYDYNDYGIGMYDDGMLLLISKEPRKYHITTYQKAVDIFNDEAIGLLKSEVEGNLRNDDYYEACVAFAETVDEVAGMYENGISYMSPESKESIVGIFMCAGIAALIAAGVMTASAYKGMNTAREKADADNYVKQGSFNLKKSNDIFLYSNLTKTKIESSSSGGGSTHRSSSGRSHGGGGGSY